MENNNLIRIQRVSSKFLRLFTVLIVSIPIFTVLFWLFFNYLPIGLTMGLPVIGSNALSLTGISLAILVSVIPVSVAVYGLNILKELFELYENAIVFSSRNVKCFRRLGYTLILWVFSNMVFVTLISVVLTYNNPIGERLIVAQFGTSDLATIIMGAIVVLVSWVMLEASKLETEQAYTV